MKNGIDEPTPYIMSLVDKFSLCLLFLASSILFFHMARKSSKSSIPKIYSVPTAIILIVIAILISSYATYEFYYIINKLKHNCSHNRKLNCVYNADILNRSFQFYLSICFAFIIINIFIAYLLYKYP